MILETPHTAESIAFICAFLFAIILIIHGKK